jgi:PAS domain S-box-containing protein
LHAAEPRVVRVGAFNYYPGIFKDADGVIKGFYVDALADIAQRENIRFEYVYGSWSDGLERIQSGEVDVLTSVAFTAERAKFMDYTSTPLLTVWGELYAPLTSNIDGIREVQNKKIAVMKGDVNGQNFIDLVKKFEITCEFVEMPGFGDVFDAVASNKVDAGVVNSTFGIARQGEYGLRSTGVVFNPFDIFFTVAKGKNQDLLALLDKNLTNWRHQADSPYNKARQKWTRGGIDALHVIPRWLVNTAAVLGVLLLVATVFVVLLKRQVRRATADIQRSKDVLLASEAKFRGYIDNSPDGVFVTDENGRYVEVNSAASSITGYSEAELLTISVLDLIPPESLEIARSHFQTLKDSGNSRSEFEFIHKTGENRWWSVDAVKLSEAIYLGFVKDITERKNAEKSLVALKDRLQEQNEELQMNEESLRDQNDELLSVEEMLRIQINEYETGQKLLKDSKERSRNNLLLLQNVIDHFPGKIFWKNTESVYLGCNKSFSDGAGLARHEEIIGKTDYDMPWSESEASNYQDLDRKVIAGKETEIYFTESQHQTDGHSACYETSKIPLRDNHGAIWGVLGVSVDISERKRTELYREMSREILHILSEPHSIQDLIQSIISTLKIRTGFDAVGIRLENGDDYPYAALEGFPKDFLPAENSLLERSVDKSVCRDKDGNASLECTCGLVITGNADPTLPFFTPGGSFWINDSLPLLDIPADEDPRLHPRNKCIHLNYASVALVPIRSQDKIVGLIQFNDHRKGCFTADSLEILEVIASHIGAALMRKKADEEKQSIEQQLQHAQKMESLGVLSGGIAHDFNNILTIILGHCYMVGSNLIAEQDYKESFKQVEIAASRAADLCRQMLTYAGKSQSMQTRVELWLLVDEVVKMLQSAIHKNVSITLDVNRDVPEIMGDSGQIQQIIMNLIINAAESIGDANGTVRVVLTKSVVARDETAPDILGSVVKAGCYACLEVSDTGCGMDEDVQKRIFEPFYTTKFTGRGLGMSAVLGIIKSHNGFIHLTSKPGAGTSFKVLFPVPAAAHSLETVKAGPAPTAQAISTVLLVEDEETLRIMGTSILEAIGYSAISAKHGKEALEIYRERGSEIDMILMDLIMPEMGGIEAYNELRKVNPAIPIVICSGYGLDSVEDVIADDVRAGFIHKPYKPEELKNILAEIMNNGD